MNIKGELFIETMRFLELPYFDFFLMGFSLFKTEVVKFSLQVFICKFAMPYINLILNMLIIFVFLFKLKSLRRQISV